MLSVLKEYYQFRIFKSSMHRNLFRHLSLNTPKLLFSFRLEPPSIVKSIAWFLCVAKPASIRQAHGNIQR
jgi:hypothetical protein